MNFDQKKRLFTLLTFSLRTNFFFLILNSRHDFGLTTLKSLGERRSAQCYGAISTSQRYCAEQKSINTFNV